MKVEEYVENAVGKLREVNLLLNKVYEKDPFAREIQNYISEIMGTLRDRYFGEQEENKMTIRELLKYYVGHTLEICSGDDCELMTRELALRLYEDSEIDYTYPTDSVGGLYLTVILKED